MTRDDRRRAGDRAALALRRRRRRSSGSSARSASTSTSARSAAVESLRVSVEAARQRGEPLDHVLLSGPPGLGKTTLAAIMANEMGATLVTTAGPVARARRRPDGHPDQPRRARRAVHRRGPPAAARGRGAALPGDGGLLDQLRDGQGAQRAHACSIPLRPFTLVAATTRPGMLSLAAARALRHLPSPRLLLGRRSSDPIVTRSASILDVAHRPGRRARPSRGARAGTPRIANRLLRRVRDYCAGQGRRGGHRRGRRARRARSRGRGRRAASTGSTAASSPPSSSSTAAGRSASRPSPRRSTTRRRRSPRWSSPFC